jgi:hypothetical protein
LKEVETGFYTHIITPMELTYDEYLNFHSRNIILVMNDGEKKKEIIRGNRQNDNGEISFLLIQVNVVVAIPLKDIDEIILD